MSRVAKPLLVVAGLGVLAAFLAGCVIVKPGSLQLSQPGEIGSVRVQFELCSSDTFAFSETCGPNEDSGQAQLMLAVAVPPGTTAPATIAAAPVAGAAPFAYHRNQEVAQAVAEAAAEELEASWPPPDSEVVGYLSEPIQELSEASQEWTVAGAFGLPSLPDGSYGRTFSTAIVWGWRVVNPELPADRPVDCTEAEAPGPTYCFGVQAAEIGVSDLQIGVPAQTRALVGGRAPVGFPMSFASSAGTNPAFALSATTTLPGGSAVPSQPTYLPGPVSPPSNRAAPATGTVVVAVPAKAKPGIYDVTLTARAPSGGVVSQTAKLRVAKPRIGFGKLKLNRRKGTATLQVKVFEAGTLSVFGKTVANVKRTPKKRKTLKVVIRAKRKAKRALSRTGRAKVRARVRFKPLNGAAVTKSRALALIKRR